MRRATDSLDKLWATKPFPIEAALIVGTGVLVGAVELFRRLFRHSKLFDPSRTPLRTWNPSDYGLDPSRVEELTFQASDGCRLHAWYCRAKNPIASISYCHGNSGNLTHSADAIAEFLKRDVSVFLFDYRGFGKSGGFPTTGGVIRDAISAAKIHDRLRPIDVPSILLGYSLGGAIAAYVPPHVSFDGMVLQSTFTDVRAMARHLSTNIPLHLISGNPLDTASALAGCKLPLLIIHGAADEVIPCTMADALYEAYPGPKWKCIVEEAHHTDLFTRDGGRIFETLEDFVRLISGKTAPGDFEDEERIA